MSVILNIPHDVLDHIIFSCCPPSLQKVWERVCMTTRNLIWDHADRCRHEYGHDLKNNVVKVLLDGSVTDLYRQNLSFQFTMSHQEIFVTIKAAQEELEKKGEEYDPNDEALVLINYAKEKQDNDLLLALVPFDLHGTVHMKADGEPGSLGDLLARAILANDTELLRVVLAHPEAKNIPCDGEYGLISAMKEVIRSTQNVSQLKMLFAHPSAEEIQEDSLDNRLGTLLIDAIGKKNLELVKALLSLPNAKNILAEGADGIADAAFIAINEADFEIFIEVLKHESASKMSVQDHGRLLQKAAASKNPKFVEHVLSLTKSLNIPAEGRYSIETALAEAVEAKNPESVTALLLHPNARKISAENFKYLQLAAQRKQDKAMMELLSGFTKLQ